MSVDDFFPVGAVIGFGGRNQSLEQNAHWLPCDGAAKYVADYEELFSVLKYSFGGSEAIFHVPDYRGAFLGGLPAGATDFGTYHEHRTARPSIAFKASFSNVPPGTFHTHGETSDACEASGSTSHPLTGGDAETRPVNVYVYWYIKASIPRD